MLPWQPFLAFYILGAHWRHLKNTTELPTCGGGDAALCQITLTTYHKRERTVVLQQQNDSDVNDVPSRCLRPNPRFWEIRSHIGGRLRADHVVSRLWIFEVNVPISIATWAGCTRWTGSSHWPVEIIPILVIVCIYTRSYQSSARFMDEIHNTQNSLPKLVTTKHIIMSNCRQASTEKTVKNIHTLHMFSLNTYIQQYNNIIHNVCTEDLTIGS